MLYKSRFLVISVLLISLLSGCAANRKNGSLVGSITGALLGSQIGAGTGSIVGATMGSAAGSVAGGYLGAAVDAQQNSIFSVKKGCWIMQEEIITLEGEKEWKDVYSCPLTEEDKLNIMDYQPS